MGVGTSSSAGVEWIGRLSPALRRDADADLRSAMGAAALSQPVAELGRPAVEWAVAVAAEMTHAIFVQIPELPQGGEVYEEARAGSEANVLAILQTLTREGEDTAELQPAAVEFARRSVRRGIPLQAILHGYRLGHQFLVHELQETIARLVEDGSLAAMQRALAVSFRYVDAGVERLVEEYEAEREHWIRTAAARRAETVHEILAGRRPDESTAGALLGYPLDRTHLAAILWSSGEGEAADGSLEHAARALAGGFSTTRPLLIPLDEHILWMWAIPGEGFGGVSTLEMDGAGGVHAAVGEPAAGVDGFRHSHEAAQEVARIARLSGDGAPSLLTWHEAGLVSLVTGDLELARSFVRRELGRLGAGKAGDLRATLRAFLAHRGSHAAAARDLYVHRNTVAYRLAQAEELLGHPVAERELELRVALEIAATLGDAVLADSPAN
jgi:DNA-binding PucR family transcriptional regulator